MKVDWKRKSLKREHLAKNQSVQLFCTSFTSVKHSCVVCWYIKIKPQVLLSDNDPLLRIGQVQIFLSSRPSPMEWSLIFLCLHQGPLRWNGHWFSYVYIKALSNGMVV